MLNARYSPKNKIIRIEINNTAALAKLQPDFQALLQSYSGTNGIVVTARTDDSAFDFHYRYFWPWPETSEAPVMGGVQTFLNRYWAMKLGRSIKKSGSMLIETLQLLFTRDLKKLRAEMELYKKEENIWKTEASIANSAGNLCLHLVGNLNTYIGKEMGKTAYVRNREWEFSAKNIPRAALLNKIDETICIVNAALDNLQEGELAIDFPVLVWEEKTSTGYLLVHLATHLTYHLGQINYHRRLIDE